MSTISRVIAVALLALLISAKLYANTITPQIGGGISQFDGGISAPQAASGPAPTGAILRIDNTSNILRIDGTSLICRAGGGC